MTNAVTRWPHVIDPRPSWFGVTGFDQRGCPAYVFTLKSVGALAPFDLYDAGITIGLQIDTVGLQQWGRLPHNPDNILTQFAIQGWVEPVVGPPDYTVRWSIVTSAPGGLLATSEATALLPDPILSWPTFTMFDGVLPSTYFPNPMVVTPRKWDYPLTP